MRTAVKSLIKKQNNMSTTTDTLFAPLTIAAAPEAFRPALEKIEEVFGVYPQSDGHLLNNPVVLQGYLALDAAFEKRYSHPENGRSSWLECGKTIAITAWRHIPQSPRAVSTRQLKSLQQSATIRRYRGETQRAT